MAGATHLAIAGIEFCSHVFQDENVYLVYWNIHDVIIHILLLYYQAQKQYFNEFKLDKLSVLFYYMFSIYNIGNTMHCLSYYIIFKHIIFYWILMKREFETNICLYITQQLIFLIINSKKSNYYMTHKQNMFLFYHIGNSLHCLCYYIIYKHIISYWILMKREFETNIYLFINLNTNHFNQSVLKNKCFSCSIVCTKLFVLGVNTFVTKQSQASQQIMH